MMAMGSPGPATLGLVVVGAAIAAVLIGWIAGREGRATGLVAGAIAFLILGGGGLLFAVRAPAPASRPAPSGVAPSSQQTPEPLLVSKEAGGTLESARKPPSVGASDMMMLWTLPEDRRVAFCVKEMRHFAQDCRDAVDGMKGMREPVVPGPLRDNLAAKLRGDLLNRDTALIADSAVEAARAANPDQMLSFPSPGGTNVDFLWCGGRDDAGFYERALNSALAAASRAGLKFPDGVVIGRVRVIRSDDALKGSTISGDAGSPPARLIADLVHKRTGDVYAQGAGALAGPLEFHVCG